MTPSLNLTAKQEAALLAAYQKQGSLFQVPENPRHHPSVLAARVKKGLLEKAKVGTVWTLTDASRKALKSVY